MLLAYEAPRLLREALLPTGENHLHILSASKLRHGRKELESIGISYLLVRMSDNKVVGTGGDGQSSHREVVSRHCAVKLGMRNRHKGQLEMMPSLRKD